MVDNAHYRYGSASFADTQDLRNAGAFTQQENSFLVGFHGNKPLFFNGAGAITITAGARAGKLASILGFSVCAGICSSTQIILDMKGELAAISQNQTDDKKHCIYWNPLGLHGLPQNRINPVDYVHINSPSLVSDVKAFCENRIPESGSASAAYFEGRARQYCEGISLALTEMNENLTLPELYHAINLIAGGGEEWLNLAYAMSTSQFELARSVEEEIATSRENPSNGFQGIIGELMKSFASLSDPRLRESVSPPYDFSLSELTASNQRYNLYLMPPAEFIAGWAPEIKSLFTSAMIYKARAPHAPQQTWIIDEVGQLGKFPLAVKLCTYGAGIGCRPVLVFQSTKQMNALQNDAESIITSSAACQIYFGVRDLQTATTLSRMMGSETLEYQDEYQQLQHHNTKRQAVQAFLMGDDPLSAGLQYAQASQALETPQKQQRLIRTPDEILNMPDDRAFIFMDGLSKAAHADRKPYYEQRFMAGRYHPNPYHPPLDKVKVKMLFGHRWKKVINAPVPDAYAHYPQYKEGVYSYVLR